ncbi:MAG: hypothetical protein ABL308_06780 [Oceanicaulis sp.]
MRQVTLFPPYKQPENLVTNAVLVLLSQVYRLAPELFAAVLTSLTETESQVGPQFNNQIRVSGGTGIPDALIHQPPFKLYVETKLNDYITEDQIRAHVSSIRQHEPLVPSTALLGLTKDALDAEHAQRLSAICESGGVRFVQSTFAELAELIRNNSAEFRTQINDIVDEFHTFLVEADLIPISENRLLVNPCGTSFEQNERWNIYHDQPGRSKSFCKYIGIYKNKSVRLVGRVRGVVVVEFEGDDIRILENFRLPWEPLSPVNITAEFKARMFGIADSSPFYSLRDEEVRFYLVDRLVPTDFRKVSPQGIMGHRYFVLDSKDPKEPAAVPELFLNGEPSIETLADALRQKTWT